MQRVISLDLRAHHEMYSHAGCLPSGEERRGSWAVLTAGFAAGLFLSSENQVSTEDIKFSIGNGSLGEIISQANCIFRDFFSLGNPPGPQVILIAVSLCVIRCCGEKLGVYLTYSDMLVLYSTLREIILNY